MQVTIREDFRYKMAAIVLGFTPFCYNNAKVA